MKSLENLTGSRSTNSASHHCDATINCRCALVSINLGRNGPYGNIWKSCEERKQGRG